MPLTMVRANAVRSIDGHEVSSADRVDEAVAQAGGIRESADNLTAVVQAQSLGESAARDIQGHENPAVNQPAVVYAVGIDEETAGDTRVVDAGGLRSAHRAGDHDHVEHSAHFVVRVGNVRGGVVDAVAVIAGRLVVVVLAQQLVEGSGDLGAGIVDGVEPAIDGAEEAVSDARVINVEAIGRQEVVDTHDLGHHGVRKVLGGESVGQYQSESLVLIEVVIAGDYVTVVDAQQLGKGNVGVAEDDVRKV